MKIALENASSLLTVDLFGAAITDFHLKDEHKINPLSFAFTKEQMPGNNKKGAPYQGHFLCLGRWGLPSAGEIKAGIPNHGEVANISWTKKESSKTKIIMETTANKEGLHVERIMEIDKNSSVYAVKEIIANIQSLGRLYNMVQHPTLAAPFLNNFTIIDCNATIGFDQANYKSAAVNFINWPIARDDKGNGINLRNPQTNYNAVFSFIVNEESEYGWITTYSPQHHLLLGYVWKRSDYPWIHIWQHWENHEIKYRGIEFGTAGIHQPFNEILDTATNLFGEKTFAYIDAGETISKNYFSFIYKFKDEFTGIENISIASNAIQIRLKESDTINIDLNSELLYELYK